MECQRICAIDDSRDDVLLDQRPSLLTLRHRLLDFVRMIHRYYAADHWPRSCGHYGLSLRPPSYCWLAAGVSEVPRFSCMKLPGVSGVYDYAGPDRNSRYRPRPCCLPPMQKRQRPDCIFSESQYPAKMYPCLRFATHLAVCSAKLRLNAFRYSFLVGLFHSLLHAGLSRRTALAIICQ